MISLVVSCRLNFGIRYEILRAAQHGVGQSVSALPLCLDVYLFGDYLFTGRHGNERCLTTRQYARLLTKWVAGIGLDPSLYGTHSLRRTKATLIYRRTGNMRAVQLLLGHTKVESTVRYLGVEVDDALNLAEQVDV